MIHAYALEPELVATWARRSEFRLVFDKFGVGTPRALLELPAFKKWKRAVFQAAKLLNLGDDDLKRIEELLKLFGDHRVRRGDTAYDGLSSWLENAEAEHDRLPFAAVLARENPRGHRAVLTNDQLDAQEPRWSPSTGAVAQRTPADMAAKLDPLLQNASEFHFVDPHFGPGTGRHLPVLEALLDVIMQHRTNVPEVWVHCSGKHDLRHFETSATAMALRLPAGSRVSFARWAPRAGGDAFHNRYALTNLGGVILGNGFDTGPSGQTDDLSLMSRDQYLLRWNQFAARSGAFDLVDTPAPITGSRSSKWRP